MNDRADVEAILDRFRDWLEDARAVAEGPAGLEPGLDSEPGPPPREFGIIDLVEEFTALRHELKLQTKSGRGLIEQTETTVAALRQAIDQFRSVEPKEAQAVWAAAKALAEALADLDEALVRGEREIDRARRQIADESVRGLETALDDLHRRRSWIRRRFLRSYHQEVIETVRRDGQTRHELFDSFLEGYRLDPETAAPGAGIRAGHAHPLRGQAGRSRADDGDRSRRRTARSARDRGQGAEARLYLEGPRDPLRGSASGARGLEIAVRHGTTKTRTRSSRTKATARRSRRGCRTGMRIQGAVRLDSDRLRNDDMNTDTIIGIDLGTTNSEVAVIRDGRPVVLEEDGDPILPSVVGLDPQGHLLVGKAAATSTFSLRNGPSDRSSGKWARRSRSPWATRNTRRKKSRRSS